MRQSSQKTSFKVFLPKIEVIYFFIKKFKYLFLAILITNGISSDSNPDELIKIDFFTFLS